jgi:diguanylate cyclase (GGDEF)-like protein/PAS domain S-box-containing protein
MSDPVRSAEATDLTLSIAALGALFDYVDQAVLCCDERGTINFASRAVRTLLGYDPMATVGRNLLDFVHVEDRRRTLKGLERWVGRAGAPEGESIRVRTSSATWRKVHYDAVIGESVGRLGTVIITLRAAEETDRTRAFRPRLLGEDRLVRLASLFLEHSVEDFDKALAEALEELAGLDMVTRASVYLVDPDDYRAGGEDDIRLSVRAQWEAPADAPRGLLPPAVRASGSQLVKELSEGREVRMGEPWHLGIEFARERELLRQARNRSVLAVPMMTDGGFVGFVMLESTIGDVAYDAAHTNTLRSAAAIFAGAVVRHAAELRLAAQARTDRVTGLGNRWAFDEAIEHALTDVAVGSSPGFGLALVDLDRFKVVNDSLGHAVGDRLLAAVAARLRSAADEDTVVARLGGDELLVLVDRSPDHGDTIRRLADLLAALRPPFDVGGQPMAVTASVGVVHADDGSVGSGELLRRADVAMYRAKAKGGDDVSLDDPASRAGEWARLWREAELRTAVRGDGLIVYYQGEWDLISGELLGAEALVRWRHPVEGILTAADFIPLAEESGLIDEVGRVVLSRACREAAGWSAARHGHFVLRVNLAAEQLRHADLPARVRNLLADAGLPAESLCLELTESSLLADPAGAAGLFAELRDQGVGLAIDDFGTGYSSILQLKRLPLTSLKIDRSFVTGLPDVDIDRAIVKATVQLADALGVTVTAEGVETEAQREALIDLGCHRAQGYLLARPEPAATFATRVLASLP